MQPECGREQERDGGVPPASTLFVLFGASGDLSWRMIVPALYNLHLDGALPERFLLLGVDREERDAGALAEHYQEGVRRFSRRGAPQPEKWQEFARRIAYQRADLLQPAAFAQLSERLRAVEQEWGGAAERVFYMATPPSLFVPIARGLASVHIPEDRERVRAVVEKPLGHDLDSFCQINDVLTQAFSERQLFRIDHFLGKETVQNILAMRFANPIFEPIWNRRYIDHVAITVAETLGVEQRGAYYEHAGALRDMVQNHLLQLLCLVAMEPPVAYGADDIRSKKMDVLRALRPIDPARTNEVAARGQYGPGWIEGARVPGYREEAGVAPGSSTETFAALKLLVDNWRWQDVPFYLRTGKRMARNVSEISIRFRDVPHRSFPASADLDGQPVRLVIQIQPEQGIVLRFMAKQPGAPLRLRPVDMRFSYKESFGIQPPDAYETLLRDVMLGDATLFMRGDQVEAAWRLLGPVLAAWQAHQAPDFPNYDAGTFGPESAEVLVARDGRIWLTPA